MAILIVRVSVEPSVRPLSIEFADNVRDSDLMLDCACEPHVSPLFKLPVSVVDSPVRSHVELTDNVKSYDCK